MKRKTEREGLELRSENTHKKNRYRTSRHEFELVGIWNAT